MFFRSLFPRARASQPRVPAGTRVYAVGDIHGRDDLLADLLARIAADHRQRGAARGIVVFLGDLIDRGPDSAGVIARLQGFSVEGFEPVFLLGNHEEVLLRILAGESALVGDWLRFGGAECLASYGLDAATLSALRPSAAVARIRQAIPSVHADFLAAFEDSLRIGDYLFVHAGIRPGKSIDRQLQSDMRWIRAPFLDSDEDHGFVVVHGHTITTEVEHRRNRIGIDTGAYASGRLTALGLEQGAQWLLQTEPAIQPTAK